MKPLPGDAGMKTRILLAAVLIAIGSSVIVSAQTTPPNVDKRERRQQARIHEGVKSGMLTPGETRRLEARESKINADEMKVKSDGKVTLAERRKLQRELNRASRKMYRLKHNKVKQNPGQRQ